MSTSTVSIGIVKQVLAGDTIVLKKPVVKGVPFTVPAEKVICLSGITTPKLGRQKSSNSDVETKDEPFAWEAREFIRKKLIGKEVTFTIEKIVNVSHREFGQVWSGKDRSNEDNVAELLLAEGLAKVREANRKILQYKKFVDLETVAKSQGKGIWSAGAQHHVRNYKSISILKENLITLKDKPVRGIVEYVRDGSTLRLMLLPDFYQVTFILAGIKCPSIKQDGESEKYAEEARYFVESLLLQRDIEVLIDSESNNIFFGTVIYQGNNIAEDLLKQGLARCINWSLKRDIIKLKAAEQTAKESKLKIWHNYIGDMSVMQSKDKEFQAVVTEVINGDALIVRLANQTQKKIFLASIRPPRERESPVDENKKTSKQKSFKPLYDIPWMFEAREYLRKKLIGKKVTISIDYIQAAKDKLPEKTCCSVVVGGINVSEELVAKGLATVVRYSKDNHQRSLIYDNLLEAEAKAKKASVGVHCKKDIPMHRIQDTSGDATKARKFLPFLKRTQFTDGLVEFVASGSRLRVYIPKESVMVTFLLAGIICPRAARPTLQGALLPAEKCGEQALQFTKDKCLQRDVKITIEDMDKAGSFIGWLWVDNINLSIALVEAGLATVHHSAETSEFGRQIKQAQELASKKHIGVWKDLPVPNENQGKNDEQNAIIRTETVPTFEKVIITEITPDGKFYAQCVEKGPKLVVLMEDLHKKMKEALTLSESFTPRRGIICAARFSADDQWYRAKIEKVHDNKFSVLYIDYGNREVVTIDKLAKLPASCESDAPYATEFGLWGVQFPNDPEDRLEAVRAMHFDTLDRPMLMETKGGGLAILLMGDNHQDLAQSLLREGLLVLDRHGATREDYKAAQQHAKTSRLNLWRHGDITDDDVNE